MLAHRLSESERPPTTPTAMRAAAAILLVSVATIWFTRSQVTEQVYVSGLGATGMPTADVFNTALLGIGVGALLGAPSLAGIRSGLRWLSWSASGTLVATALAFVGASQITCTYGCPIPFTPGSTLQDLVHIVFAATGFTGAAVVMVQLATSSLPRPTRLIAWGAAGATGLVAAAGASLSLLRFRTDLGATLEFIAMTVGVVWLAGLMVRQALLPAERARATVLPVSVLS
ncbi:DUF998 domain-containing protein [Pseudoclavibacter sp. 8L]|uniref:DUF998 domain-containing protein n=1 Tax=Pseudoclavibacter sp. 8L TaxID=2653162 RepID=UPI00135B6489|nr:DUF998 domain-containing protein [Pseudoclavibacter sp. 8L]